MYAKVKRDEGKKWKKRDRKERNAVDYYCKEKMAEQTERKRRINAETDKKDFVDKNGILKLLE